MNRIDRVTAILIQLQHKRVVKAQEIAERFGISLRTVYRDIKTIEEAGVPVIGEAGIGYSIMEGYRLPPVMFTPEEATAFLTAEKIIDKFTDSSTAANYRSALYKVRSVLRSAEKDFLEDADRNIQVAQQAAPASAPAVDNPIQTILKSIGEKKVLAIHYEAGYSSEAATSRDIEPIGISFLNNRWHPIAFCLLRNDYRDFRIDRIARLSLTARPHKKLHPGLDEYLQLVAQKQQLAKVVIRVAAEKVKYINEQNITRVMYRPVSLVLKLSLHSWCLPWRPLCAGSYLLQIMPVL